MLRGKKDAYGKLIKDHSDGGHVFEIIERDDGQIEVGGGPKVYFTTFESWQPQTREAISLAKGRVLDIGCGAGRFSLYLQEKGFDVIGIDNSELAVKVCQSRGVKNVLPVGVEEIDGRLGKFDTVLMFGNGFGLMHSFDKAKQILCQLKEITSDDALIIAESINPYGTPFQHDLRYFDRNRNKGRMPGQMRIRIRHLDYKTPYFDFLQASPEEINEILEGTGWKLDSTLGNVKNGFVAVINKK